MFWLDIARRNEPMSVSNEMSLDSDDHGNGNVSDGDRHHHQELNVCTSEKKNEAMENLKNADKKVGCKQDSCLTETELLLKNSN